MSVSVSLPAGRKIFTHVTKETEIKQRVPRPESTIAEKQEIRETNKDILRNIISV